jgi:uncharacterized protein with PQ loop repeat
MAKVTRSQQTKKIAKKKKLKDISLPFTKENYYILIAGIAVIVIGYILMELGGAYDSLSLVISPIILVIGYCVIIPFSIFYRKKNTNKLQSSKS